MADLAGIARLFAHPTRAAIVAELLGGIGLPSGAIAHRAGVTPSAVSIHLSVLMEGGIVTVVQQGRWRLYQLADQDVARLVEALNTMSTPVEVQSGLRAQRSASRLRYARSCYDHLAGQLAINLVDGFVARGWLQVDDAHRPVLLTQHGQDQLTELGFLGAIPSTGSRPFLRSCTDWTERREHVAGLLGSALLTGMLDRKWVERSATDRSLNVTPVGHGALADWTLS